MCVQTPERSSNQTAHRLGLRERGRDSDECVWQADGCHKLSYSPTRAGNFVFIINMFVTADPEFVCDLKMDP